jgi:acetyl-CoA C-acetyltransferase
VRVFQGAKKLIHPNTPVLIAGGQFTYRGEAPKCPTPIELCAIAAQAAAQQIGHADTLLATLDGLAVVGFTIDAGGGLNNLPISRAVNPPNALAKALGAKPSWKTYTHVGGNTPQSLVNEAAERIANGENKFVLLVGAEFLGSLMKLVQAGDFDALKKHKVDDDEAPDMFGDGRPGCSDYERAHGLEFPANVYPMFENAYRAQAGMTLEHHRASMGKLFAPFTQVAQTNPFAWFPTYRDPEELTTVTAANRMVGFPYPKYLNSILQVDQSAGVLMASYAHAKSLGIAEEKMVFLHGCADTVEKWNVLDRVNYYSSPAIDVGIAEAFDMAGKRPQNMDFFDLYSCFPIAVTLAAQTLGLGPDDPCGLTLTGGLPYFGGPGNNYSMHAIVEAIARCQEKPDAFGFVNANGWFLTKHAFGIYGATPTERAWSRRAKSGYQSQIDRLQTPPVTEQPDGPSTIETYTVVHSRDTMRMGIVIGRDGQGNRFVANTPKGDVAMMAELQAREGVGRTGTVRHENGRNVFVLGD